MCLEVAFELLGLQHDCTMRQLRERFGQLALEVHPDKGGSREDFLLMREAYHTICESRVEPADLSQALEWQSKREEEFKYEAKEMPFETMEEFHREFERRWKPEPDESASSEEFMKSEAAPPVQPIMIYEEPMERVGTSLAFRELGGAYDNFTQGSMTDLHEAYSTRNPEELPCVDEKELDEKLHNFDQLVQVYSQPIEMTQEDQEKLERIQQWKQRHEEERVQRFIIQEQYRLH